MATLKHIASKNSDYTAIEAYLVYQHDAFTGKQLLDDVPQKFLELYYRLHNAESLMRKSWEVTFDLNPKLLTHPEQVKVLRFALKPHLEFLKALDEVLAESSGESSKTA